MKKILITDKWLKTNDACIEAIEWLQIQEDRNLYVLLDKIIAERNKEHLKWANWAIVRCMDYSQYVYYAVFAAELVLDIFEKKHLDDKRPKEAIRAAKNCIDNPNEENKDAANIAADAAAAIASASVIATVHAAYAATAYAAYAATYAATAYATSAATSTASAIAAYADTSITAFNMIDRANDIFYNNIIIKILKEGIKILKK